MTKMTSENKKNIIVLSGFMGCGKTTVGKILSAITGYKFIDLDEFIEDKLSAKICDIFAKHGENYFREEETSALKDILFSNENNIVLSLGGGAIINSVNAEIIRENGTVFYINLPFETCYERIYCDKNRPLASSGDKNALFEKFCSRENTYKKTAHFIINGENSPEIIAEEIYRNTKE